MKVWMNGKFVPQDQAVVPILSHGFSRGSAIFEVLDLSTGDQGLSLFRLDAHVDRFFRSAEIMQVSLPLSAEQLSRAVVETAAESGVTEGVAKFFAYYAGTDVSLMPAAGKQINIAVFCYDLAETIGKTHEELAAPARAGISALRKVNAGGSAVQAKVAGQYVPAYLAVNEIRRKGYDEVIMLDQDGFIAESGTMSVFFVKDGRLLTSTLRNALPGITRDSVIAIARDAGIEVIETDITGGQITEFDEAMFTSTVVRVKPILSIDESAMPGTCPGPVTSRVTDALNDVYAGRNSNYAQWLTPVR